jgi:hypothetical protein
MEEILNHATPISPNSSPDGFSYSFQYTTTIFNIEHIFDFIDFMIDEGYIQTTETIDFFYAWSPQWSSINNLSQKDKDRVSKLFSRKLKKIKSDKTKSQLTSILNYMNTPSNYSLADMKVMIEKLDTLNNTDYKNICKIKL